MEKDGGTGIGAAVINAKGKMERITIDALERQARSMNVRVLDADIPGTTCGLYCDRLRTIWLADWLNDRQRLCTLCSMS